MKPKQPVIKASEKSFWGRTCGLLSLSRDEVKESEKGGEEQAHWRWVRLWPSLHTVMANLDYIWNQLKPKQPGTLLRDFFFLDWLIWGGKTHAKSRPFNVIRPTLNLGHIFLSQALAGKFIPLLPTSLGFCMYWKAAETSRFIDSAAILDFPSRVSQLD